MVVSLRTGNFLSFFLLLEILRQERWVTVEGWRGEDQLISRTSNSSFLRQELDFVLEVFDFVYVPRIIPTGLALTAGGRRSGHVQWPGH